MRIARILGNNGQTALSVSYSVKLHSLFSFFRFFQHTSGIRIGFVEDFKVMLLSRADRVLGIEAISSGGAMTVVDVKLVFAAVIKSNCHSIIVIGRKAFLFAGSHQAAEMAAGMYSFMASCKKNNINEFE